MTPKPVTRSIKLKLVVPRDPAHADLRRCLWATHAAVNGAAAYYERLLVLMRGRAYLTEEGRVDEGAVVGELLGLAREAQERNGRRHEGGDEELLGLLRALYVDIVPSAEGRDGNAQAANAFLSPLTDKDSRGFLEVFDKIANPPNWLAAARDGEAEAFEAAHAWLGGEAGRRRLRATGAPGRWMRLAKADPRGSEWVLAFIADLDAKVAEAEGVPTRIRRLRELGVLPLFEPYFKDKIANAEGVVTPWDRLAFRLAVGHLLSWESWCRRAAEDHARRRERLERFEAAPELAGKLEALRVYERERPAELAEISDLPQGERVFRVRGRMVRGWDDLRERWLRAKRRDQDTLLALLAEAQTRLRGRFGDPHLFRWLARPGNHAVWSDPAHDAVGVLAALNGLRDLVERSRETALLTLPDPVEHPRSAQWEAEGGSNLKTYRLHASALGLEVALPALRPLADGRLEDAVLPERLRLAPSDQAGEVELIPDGKRRRIVFTTNAGERLRGDLGSADLLLDWQHLRHRRERLDEVAAGEIGPAWLKLALDLEPVLPEGWDSRRPAALAHFRTAAGRPTRWQGEVRAGLRVLAVDLGVRAFAACAVFELREGAQAGAAAFPVPDLGLVAVHERSFLLRLPGEVADAAAEAWRERAGDELRRLRRGLDRCRRVYRLAGQEGADRAEGVAALREALAEADPFPFEDGLVAELEAAAGLPLPLWDAHVGEASRRWRDAYGLELAAWRRATRARSLDKRSGKSAWAIQHLTDARRLLVGWSLLGQRSGDVRRLDRERRGVFAAGLLAHLDGLKDDRIKTGADLIVQAARGFVRDERGRWERRHEPCPIVVFEDLARYRTRTDRPRRENSQLMRWAHRAIVEQAAMQGELYGLFTTDVGAAFTSRYHAASGTPGVRCRALARHDLEDGFLRELIGRENPGLDLAGLAPGDLVPMGGGGLFVCLGRDGRPVRVHADLNAAQNLQRRFWGRHGEAFRLPAQRVAADGGERWVPARFGERLRGALGGHGWLEPTGHESGSCRWRPLTAAEWRREGGGGAAEEGEEGEDVELADLKEELAVRGGAVTVFFRDPSGVVLPSDLWLPQKTFWSMVKARTTAALRLRA